MTGALIVLLPAAVVGMRLTVDLVEAFDGIQDRHPRFRSFAWHAAGLAVALAAGMAVAIGVPLTVLLLQTEAAR